MALERRLADHPRRLASELALAEVPRAVRRAVEEATGTSVERALGALDRIITHLDLVTVDQALLRFVGRLQPPSLRTLDAIHIASALVAPGAEGLFVSYDRRQLEAARAAGLTVGSPGAER